MSGPAIQIAPDRAALVAQARQLAQMAYEEDVGRGDITSALLEGAAAEDGRFSLTAKQPCIFAGREIVGPVLEVFGDSIDIVWTELGSDGQRIEPAPDAAAWLTGPVDVILTAERTLLNFLQRLCGIATNTRRFVDAVSGTGAGILDTRKTTPGWRHLEKYAVRCGGGLNHRMGLHDAVLIKDNHLAPYRPARTAAAVFEMLNRAAAIKPPPKFIEVEAASLDEAEQLLDVVGIDVIMLDNFATDDLERAVALRAARNLADAVKLEASGGVTLATVRRIAETGVDYISVGALTHSATAVDISLERVA